LPFLEKRPKSTNKYFPVFLMTGAGAGAGAGAGVVDLHVVSNGRR
jgi:hypothetical protein